MTLLVFYNQPGRKTNPLQHNMLNSITGDSHIGLWKLRGREKVILTEESKKTVGGDICAKWVRNYKAEKGVRVCLRDMEDHQKRKRDKRPKLHSLQSRVTLICRERI